MILHSLGLKMPVTKVLIMEEYLPLNFRIRISSQNSSASDIRSQSSKACTAGIDSSDNDSDDESDEGRIRVKLFSDPTQILYVNVVLDKSNDEEAK